MAALLDILHSLEVVIEDKDQAAVANRRVCSFFDPSTDQPPASGCPQLGITLELLRDLIKNKDDANLAMSCIAKKLRSLAAGSATSQKSDSSQHAPSSSSPPFSTHVATSSLPAEAQPTATIESEVPESPSTDSTVSNVAQSQQSSVLTDATSPPPSEAESNAPIESKVSRQSSHIAAPVDQKPSASSQRTSSPPSKEVESPAPVQSVVVNFSSTAAAHPGTIKHRQHPAPIVAPQPSTTQPNGAPIILDTTQSQQPFAPATAPKSSSTRPKRPLYTANQLTPRPYRLIPTYDPDDGEYLPPEIAKSVGNYHTSSYVVLLKLFQHGGFNYDPPGSKDGVPSFQELSYLDYFQNARSMTVQRDVFKDHNGWEIDIPRVSCEQYLDLYNSMIHRKPIDLSTICRRILVELETAIENRAAVYKWYESLPPTDYRIAYNLRHLAFLQMFEKLESAVNRYLLTGTPRLIQR